MNNSYEHGIKQTTHNRNQLLSLLFFSFFQLLFCNADLARAKKDDNGDDDDDDDAEKHRILEFTSEFIVQVTIDDDDDELRAATQHRTSN